MITVKRKPWGRVIAVGVVLLGAAAYIEYRREVEWSLPLRIKVTGNDPQIIVQRTRSGMAALLIGELRYDAGGRCLLVVRQDGRPITPVWPKGTKSIRENGKHGVAVPRFGKILDGDSLAAGGGYQDPEVSPALADIDLPDRCLTPGFFIFSGQFREQSTGTGDAGRS